VTTAVSGLASRGLVREMAAVLRASPRRECPRGVTYTGW
jgi:hypothetical protein